MLHLSTWMHAHECACVWGTLCIHTKFKHTTPVQTHKNIKISKTWYLLHALQKNFDAVHLSYYVASSSAYIKDWNGYYHQIKKAQQLTTLNMAFEPSDCSITEPHSSSLSDSLGPWSLGTKSWSLILALIIENFFSSSLISSSACIAVAKKVVRKDLGIFNGLDNYTPESGTFFR